mgnify:CR=1 FL=1
MSASERIKGKRAENEFLKLLNKLFLDRGIEINLRRNLQQTQQGGADSLDLEGVAIEVKRHERLSIAAWWRQALTQAGQDRLPVLAYRQSRKSWTVLVPSDRFKGEWEQQTFRRDTGLPPAWVMNAEAFVEICIQEGIVGRD